MSVRLDAIDVPCPACRAKPGDRCTYVKTPRFRGQLMKAGFHWSRDDDAETAQRTANVLVDALGG